MKTRNKIIVYLVLLGIILYVSVQCVIIPQNNIKKEQYAAEQLDPVTHDLNGISKYKSKYMGDSSNIINLFYSLPLSNVGMTFELFPEELTLEVNYKETVGGIGEERLNKALIYNSTSAFALIENLEAIKYNFPGSSYKALRFDFQKWYGDDLSSLLIDYEWKSKVQDRLKDNDYINNFIKEVFMVQ